MVSTTSRYALRALVHLAQASGGVSVLGRELSEATGIPANYLSKILLALRNAGLVATARGSGGGYRLSKPAAEIRLIEIVELFERGAAVPECILGAGRPCAEQPNLCTAHAAWRHVREAYTGFLGSTNLEQIACSEGVARQDSAAMDRQQGGARS